MDLQAEIRWIQEELNNVTDVELIKAFKSLLKYRKRVSSEEGNDFSLSPAHMKLLEKAEKRHLSGISRSYTWDEVKNYVTDTDREDD
ncbi:hypothetical protein [Sinomicrobium weinanense]|uniref:Uncharacterized protein n=1 Tax=Sinomicrobium weinanense TaxID=2842200 RepID=A0A926Q4C7_9FLAO|nr:hypothetical protein [Sinomicrobium weinanense]MBC9798473.1 hypothetical protein [Sinomicrobium weinanense]MBU3123891.1 hypothetical protein [Sinomicrobium weinanense]